MENLEKAKSEWDLVIIGGGITGTGIFCRAVRMGLSVLLIERGDFAGGTSSRSSKLVHGGLRYLKEGRLHLTLESVRERQRLLREAPGLVDPLGFLMPVYKDKGPGRWTLALGLSLYDMMSFKRQHRFYPAKEFLQMVPGVRQEGLVGGFRFLDAQVDDARLVLRLLDDGRAGGGTAINYAMVKEITRGGDGNVTGVRVADSETGIQRDFAACAVINASGAWAETLHPSPDPKRHLRPLRGSHLVFAASLLQVTEAVSFTHPSDGRPVFLLPWEGAVLLGTTDLDHGEGLFRDPVMTRQEADYLVAGLNAFFPGRAIRVEDAVAGFSGIRPVLSEGEKEASQESREHVVWVDRGLVTVTGGKLTTFGCLAKDTLKAAGPFLPRVPPCGRRTRDVKPAPPKESQVAESRIGAGMLRRLFGRYGKDAAAIIQNAPKEDLAVIPGTLTLWAELPFCAGDETIRHLTDLLLRRVRIGLLLPGGGVRHLDRIQGLCAPVLGWDGDRWEAERAAYAAHWQATCSVPPPTGSVHRDIHV